MHMYVCTVLVLMYRRRYKCPVMHMFCTGAGCEVHGEDFHRPGQVWCLGLLRRVQSTGGGRAQCCVTADTGDPVFAAAQIHQDRIAGKAGEACGH